MIENQMTEDTSSTQDQSAPKPHPTLKVLEIMVGTWDLQGRDFTTNAESEGSQASSGWKGGSFLYTGSTSIMRAESLRVSSTSVMTRKAGT